MSLQKIWTKPLDSYGFVLQSLYDLLQHQSGKKCKSCLDTTGGGMAISDLI